MKWVYVEFGGVGGEMELREMESGGGMVGGC